MVEEKVILDISTNDFPVTVIVEQVGSCDMNINGEETLTIENYNETSLTIDLEINEVCEDIQLLIRVIDSSGCSTSKVITVKNPCYDFDLTATTVESRLDTIATVIANESFWVEWLDINGAVISTEKILSLPTGSGNRTVRGFSQKGCADTKVVSFGNLTALPFSKDLDDCKSAMPTQINFNDLIQPTGLYIQSIQIIGSPPQYGTYNIIGNNILVYSQNVYPQNDVTETFQVEITTYLGVAICDVTFNIAACIVCVDDADLIFDGIVSTSGENSYIANKVPLNPVPTNVQSDEVYYSLDNGLTWTLGDSIPQCDVFNSMAYFWTECTNPQNNTIEWTIKGKRCGSIGANSGTLTFKQKSNGNVIQTLSAGAITTTNGESIFTSVNNIFNWDGIIAEFDFTFDDGYVLNAVFEYENTFLSGSDTSNCDGTDTNTIGAIGSQKLVRFKRVIEFTDDCETVVSEYFMSFVETPNVLPNNLYVNGIKI
ncbi:MAG: hypothetical protein AB8G11_22425 [Saprospiraceae bacterium]